MQPRVRCDTRVAGRDPRRMNVIEVTDLTKRYGDRAAVDGVSFSVEEGEIFGILGPNGAGKTTTVESIAGLRTPDSRHDQRARARPATGPRPAATARRRPAPGERAARPDDRSARRSTCSRRSTRDPADPRTLHRRPRARRQARHRRTATSRAARSSGCRSPSRSSGSPKIAILDELSTGLDPQARRETWQLIESIRDRGVTVLLVTHLMEEAERLADRVARLRRGPRRSRSTRRPASSRWSTPSSGSGSGRRRRSTTGCSPTCPRCRRVERTGPIVVVDRHRQPHPGRHVGPGPAPDRGQRPAHRAGEPRRRLPRPDRPAGGPHREGAVMNEMRTLHRHRGEAAVPRARSRGSRRSPCRRSSS